MKPSGIGGQAVIEGIMMKNKNRYSIAVRKPNNEIEVVVKKHNNLSKRIKILRLPIIRGVFNFIDSLVIGMSTLTYSASFYEDPQEQAPTPADKVARSLFKDKLDSIVMALTIIVAIVLALGLFMALPFYLSRLLSRFIVSDTLLNLFEGLIRLLIFLGYVTAISLMNDIKRVYMYHGAEHKCINCIENGLELNVKNVRASSRQHRRCGTSFLLFVMLISIILFMFIKTDDPVRQMLYRLLLVPVVAGISYEVLKLAGRSDNFLMKIISAPGLLLQKLTTKEPDDDMIEVAIAAVEAVFDWREFRSVYDDDDEDAFEFIDDDDDVPEYVETFGASVNDPMKEFLGEEEDSTIQEEYAENIPVENTPVENTEEMYEQQNLFGTENDGYVNPQGYADTNGYMNPENYTEQYVQTSLFDEEYQGGNQ
ncbi:MAG: DUF1385 domain-containing protein [Thermoflexaceae bacterium]|nr:DUF1385 domain-containing protein [Thermoflexaceae bacterium]